MRNELKGPGHWIVVPVAALLLALTMACQAPPPSPAQSAEPSRAEMDNRSAEGAVIAAHRSLIRAFEEGDADSALALLEPTSRLLIFHPFLENRFDGSEEAREGLARMLGRLGEVTWTEVHPIIEVRGEVAWITSQVLIKSPALDAPFIGRGTEIWARRDDGWRLIHGHWSEHASLAGSEDEMVGG